MSKVKITCPTCNGSRIEKGLTSKRPCLICNGAGVLKPNMSPYSEWDVITLLLSENLKLKRENYLLRTEKKGALEQHTGKNNDGYRGD